MPSASTTSRRRRACRPNTGTGTPSRATWRSGSSKATSSRASGTTRKPTRSGPGSGTRSRRARSSWHRSSTRTAGTTVTDDQLGEPITLRTLTRPEKALSGELAYLFRSPRFNLAAGAGYSRINGHIGHHDRPRHSAARRSGSVPGSRTPSPHDVRHANALRLRLSQAAREPDPHGGRQRRLPERRQPGGRRQEPGQPEVRRGVEPVAGHDAAGGGVQGAEADAGDRIRRSSQHRLPDSISSSTTSTGPRRGATGPGSIRSSGATCSPARSFRSGTSSRRSSFVISRDVTRPGAATCENITEHLGRAYAFWTPHPWWAFSAQYLYEKNQSEGLTDVPRTVKTQRAPLGAKFFHPSGFGAG